jgi:hypothetical protein
MRRIAVSAVVSAIASVASSCASSGPRIDAYTLPHFVWADAYRTNEGEKRLFDIERLMSELGLSRLEAVELQNQYRDRSVLEYAARGCRNGAEFQAWERFDRLDCLSAAERDALFDAALAEVRAGRLESGWDATAAAAAPLVVAFDLDETLLRKTKDGVARAPGAEAALRRARALGARVALFTARNDVALPQLLDGWTMEEGGRAVPIREWVDGVFSLHHLVVQPRGPAGREVLTASKDLRVLEPSLEHVVLIDDNPSRVLQPTLLAWVPQWRPDSTPASLLVETGLGEALGAGRLSRALDEIEESLGEARKRGCSFAAAFRPYAWETRPLTEQLARARFDGALAPAVRLLRDHPELSALAH